MPIELTANMKNMYNWYDNITIEHCKNLLIFLYGREDKWVNPITKNKIRRSSNIIISFLSKCYYIWGNKKVSINSVQLTYKKHIEKFIDKTSLFDLRKLISNTKLNGGASPPGVTMKPQSTSPLGARIKQWNSQTLNIPNKPQSASPLGAHIKQWNSQTLDHPMKQQNFSPPGAAMKMMWFPGPPGAAMKQQNFSPPGAAMKQQNFSPNGAPLKQRSASPLGARVKQWNSQTLGAPMKQRSVSPLGARIKQRDVQNLGSPMKNQVPPTKNGVNGKLKFPLLKKFNEKTDGFTYEMCNNFIKNIKISIFNKTPEQIKSIKITDPVNNRQIAIDCPNVRSYLSKCYSFGDKNINKYIEEIVDIGDLHIEQDKKKFIPDIIQQIDIYKDDFIKACKKLKSNCDGNGILNDHSYISNVVNSIMIIIYTKYLHLEYLENINEDEVFLTPLYIYMYDQTLLDYYNIKGEEVKGNFENNYKKKIIYQNNDLTQGVQYNKIDMIPNINETYKLNKLFNRQYVFELLKLNNNDCPTVRYNKINNNLDIFAKDFKTVIFPNTLEYANNIFNKMPFNYSIINSTLPKYIFCSSTSPIESYFEDILTFINNKLKTLPSIKGLKTELTVHHHYYDNILADMKRYGFGNNETKSGSNDMIRKNILYSINIQQKKEDIYYNQEYSGAFPFFSWLPLTDEEADIYNFPNFKNWQPLKGLREYVEVSIINDAYKNYGRMPWSKGINDTIFKVITGEYASLSSIEDPFERSRMKDRVLQTIGIYKDIEINPLKNKKIYLYHGTINKLHSINGRDKDIEMLGFLSTTLNIHTAVSYAGIKKNNCGLIYIIEVDGDQRYINLCDHLYQIIFLPYSIIRIIYEFNFGITRVILCRLIRTPSRDKNQIIYTKLLNIEITQQPNIIYTIEPNTNIIPKCVYMESTMWKKDIVNDDNYLKIYEMSHLSNNFVYFSLGQEYELYVERGIPLCFGCFADIKYSIHQHFIKDCYKALGIPCLDYIFVHTTEVDNAISTGILIDDYQNNRTKKFKYNINNFLIDCIFKFDSINHNNKKINLPNVENSVIYADKIEGFRDAGLYLHGDHNLLFNSSEIIGEHIQYIRNWKHLFIKYRDATNEELGNHFKWCNERIKNLIIIIENNKQYYLNFINDILKPNAEDTRSRAISEKKELISMINNLTDTLKERANFYIKCTSTDGISSFIDIINELLEDEHINIHNSKLYVNNIQENLKNLPYVGGGEMPQSILGRFISNHDISNIYIKRLSNSSTTKSKHINYIEYNEHKTIYEAIKNVPIPVSKDMRKFSELPKAFQEYYNGGANKDGYIDLSNHCNCRSV